MENSIVELITRGMIDKIKDANPQYVALLESLFSKKELTKETFIEAIEENHPLEKAELIRIFEEKGFAEQLDKINQIKNFSL